MATETRTLHFTISPALKAYIAWISAEGRAFDLGDYDLFSAGYRARRQDDERATDDE